MQYFIAYLENKAVNISFLIASVNMSAFPLRKSMILGLNPFGQLNCLVQSLRFLEQVPLVYCTKVSGSLSSLLLKHSSADSSSFGSFPSWSSSSVGNTEVAVVVHVVVALVLFSIGCTIIVVYHSYSTMHAWLHIFSSKMFNYISKQLCVQYCEETFHEYPLAREVANLIHRCCSLWSPQKWIHGLAW